MLTIVDYGVGNTASLLNMLNFVGRRARLASGAEDIRTAEKLVLPGVGAFDRAMRTLAAAKLIDPLNEAVLHRKVPVLGVCLGMQLLARRSEEGELPGLGWIAGDVVRLAPTDGSLKVPHVGWTYVEHPATTPLFPDPLARERFYFVHSYHMLCDDPADQAAIIDYGGETCVAVARDNIFGVQFHPENSHRFGMRLLRDFADL